MRIVAKNQKASEEETGQVIKPVSFVYQPRSQRFDGSRDLCGTGAWEFLGDHASYSAHVTQCRSMSKRLGRRLQTAIKHSKVL